MVWQSVEGLVEAIPGKKVRIYQGGKKGAAYVRF